MIFEAATDKVSSYFRHGQPEANEVIGHMDIYIYMYRKLLLSCNAS